MDKEKLIFFLKKKYPILFETRIKDDYFIFRPLTKYEFENVVINPNIKEAIVSEIICELCVVYPENYDFENCKYAGTPEALATEIIDKSGWSDEEFIREEMERLQKKYNEDYVAIIENQILAAFPPQITPEEINHWDIYTLLDYYVRSNYILEAKSKVQLLAPKDDSEVLR